MTFDSGEVRLRPESVPEITGLRLLPSDTPADLLNISSTGLLAESIARLAVGKPAIVHFEGRFSPQVVTGRVARCEVVTMQSNGTLRYQVAIEFDAPLTLRGSGGPEVPPAPEEVRNRW